MKKPNLSELPTASFLSSLSAQVIDSSLTIQLARTFVNRHSGVAWNRIDEMIPHRVCHADGFQMPLDLTPERLWRRAERDDVSRTTPRG